MNCSIRFKLTTVALLVGSAMNANAALYTVYEYSPENDVETHGVAIQPSDKDCWNGECTKEEFSIAVETKKLKEGFNYRDESPFFSPAGFDWLSDGYDGFRDYCYRYLRYQDILCDNWSSEEWKGYSYELDGNYDNSIAYQNDTPISAENTVVNSLFVNGSNVVSIGNYRDGNNAIRNVAFFGDQVLKLPTANESGLPGSQDEIQSHGWSSTNEGGNTYVAGSISRKYDGNSYTSKAAVWINNEPKLIDWDGAGVRDSLRPQGSSRDITVIDGEIFAVGYNSDSDERLRGAIFKSADNGATWKSTFVAGFPYGVEYYLNSTLYSVNKNKISVGTSKLSEARNGSYSNSLFYVDDITSPNYNSFSGGIFFEGANGTVGAINNFNEVVGSIDAETHREYEGKPRAKRGFITTIDLPGKDPSREERLGFKAWYLDDLTNGLEDNNKYRIIDATDVNDSGVISGTAQLCKEGFSSSSHNATCSGDITLVAVKLIPISGATNDDIKPRSFEKEKVERSGAGLGWLSLTLLVLFGFRRK